LTTAGLGEEDALIVKEFPATSAAGASNASGVGVASGVVVGLSSTTSGDVVDEDSDVLAVAESKMSGKDSEFSGEEVPVLLGVVVACSTVDVASVDVASCANNGCALKLINATNNPIANNFFIVMSKLISKLNL
jgi:hypothetical protein